MNICLDPGHGMSNRRKGLYDTGAVGADCTEAEIVMDFANLVRHRLMQAGHRVIRTRVNAKDPAPVGARSGIAKEYGCEILISLHCNAANGRAQGTETFYRGAGNKALAERCNAAIVSALHTRDRGVKTEAQSQHARLAVLNFPKACLIELAFIDHAGDRARLMDDALMQLAAKQLAEAITSQATG